MMMRKALHLRHPASALTQLSKRSFADADKSLFEKAKETVGRATASVGQAFKDEGVVGKQFQDTKDGAAGAAQKTANKTGVDSLDEHGSIGKKFKDDGTIGSKVDKAGKKLEEKGEQMKANANKAAPDS